MSEDPDARLEAIGAIMAPLLTALETLERIGRHLHPPNLPALVQATRDTPAPLRDGLRKFREVAWPDDLTEFRDRVASSAEHAIDAFEGLADAPRDPNGPLKAYRAMRANTRALEALYAVAPMFPPVSRFFVEPGLRDDRSLARRLEKADTSREGVGVMHFGNDRESRGGYSLYVPEYYDESEACPLITALHGGSGHGADFLWTWLRDARSRGAIVISPTSVGRTWALMGPDVDTPNIEKILQEVSERWHVDRNHMLMTGMSDGGTFIYVSALRAESPFTHLAPSSASFHPSLVDEAAPGRLAGLPVYLMHGDLDWMFPVDFAHIANAALTKAGASVVLRAIEDLSHTYPRDENPRIMDWFIGRPVGSGPIPAG